jgi:hypothetical protein
VGKKDAGGPVPPGWLKRGEVAEALGTSIGGVRRLEGERLHPVKAANGFWYFDPKEVEAVRPAVARVPTEGAASGRAKGTADGDLAARLFPLFARGMSFADVIAETQVSPAAVRALFWEWRQGYGRPVERPTGRTTARHDDDDDEQEEPDGPDNDEAMFAAWEAEVRSIERAQARIDRLSRRVRRPRSHF